MSAAPIRKVLKRIKACQSDKSDSSLLGHLVSSWKGLGAAILDTSPEGDSESVLVLALSVERECRATFRSTPSSLFGTYRHCWFRSRLLSSSSLASSSSCWFSCFLKETYVVDCCSASLQLVFVSLRSWCRCCCCC